MSRLGSVLVSLAIATAACGPGGVSPVEFDAAHEPCRFCRMTGSNGRSAAQLVSPRDESLFFDDIGCLRGYLKQAGTVAPGAVVYVVDHRTGAWVQADRAVYTHNEAVPTPMSSHLLAHESAASREADADARGGKPVSIAEVFAGVPVPWSHDK
jgi:hypothetical protein